MVFYYNMSGERLEHYKFEIKIITQDEFSCLSPSPEELQKLVYSLYTKHGEPQPVAPPVLSPLYKLYKESDKKTAYIVATGEASHLFQNPTTEHLKRIEPELRSYKNLAGFFKVEWGIHKQNKNLPIEAMVLTKNFPWPVDTVVGCAASFTTNPLLPKQTRMEILNGMLNTSYTLAIKEGFSDRIYTIFAPHVAKFVEESGIIAIKEPEVSELSDDPYAKSVFETFPGYWASGPTLYRFIPTKI